MKDRGKTKEQLLKEVAELRREVASLRASKPELPLSRSEKTTFDDGTAASIQTIIDSLPYYVILVDEQHRILMANRALGEHFGIDHNTIIGQYCPRAIHGMEEPFPGCPLEEVVATGHTVERELSDPRIGKYFLSAVYPTSLKTADGKDVYLHTTLDITERKQAEKRVIFLAEILEHAPFSVIATDEQGNITQVNRATEKLYGYTRQELIGKDLIIFNAEPDAAQMQQDILDTLRRGKVWGGEFQNRKKNGELFYIGANIYRLKDSEGKMIALVGFQRDITGRKKAEAEIAKFKAIIDNASYGVAIGTVEEITYVNRSFAEMHGYSPDELIGKNYSILYMKEQLPVIDRLRDQLFDTGNFYNEEVWHKRKDGTVFPTLMAGSLIRDEKGKPNFIVGTVIDITERKRMEEELRESEERYRALVEAGERIGEAIIMMQNTDKTEAAHVFANQEWARITGYTTEELKEISYWDLVHPCDRDAVADRVRRRLQGDNIPGHYEITIITKDGAEVPIEVAVGYTISYNGRPANVGYIRDITRRKKAEESLQLSAQLLNNATDSIMAADLEGNIIYANDTACRTRGYTKEEMLGMNLRDTVTPQHAGLVSGRIKKVIEDGYVLFESEHKRRDGSTFPMEITARTVRLGGKNVILSVQRDITERKKAEAALRESEEFNSSVLRDSPNPIIVANPDTSVRYINPALEEMTGFSLEEVIGQKAPRPWWPEGTREKLNQELELAFGPGFKKREQLLKRKNGERFWVEATAIPVIINGELRHFVASWVEITERKRMEEELVRSRDYLERLNNSMTDMVFEVKFPERTIKYVNKAVETVLGYTQEECTGQSIGMIYPSQKVYREVGKRMWAGIERGDEIITSEHELKRKDGKIITVEGRTNILRGGDGAITALSVVRDITERKRAEKALQESEQRYIAAEMIGNFGHWQRKINGQNLIWSEGSYRIFGVHPGKFKPTRKTAGALIHPDDLAALNNAADKSGATGEPMDIEYRIIRPYGEERIVHDAAYIVFDEKGKPDRIFGTLQDITERKLAQAALQESEGRYRALVEAADRIGQAIVLLQDTDRVKAAHVFASQEWARITGYTIEELKDISYYDLFHTRHQAAVIDRTKRRLSGENIPGQFELTIITKDGREVPVEVTGSSAIPYKGKPASIAYIRDITERKRMEEERQRAAKLESLGTMAGGIAHDFNNLLTGILGNVSLARRYVEPDSKAAERLGEAEKASMRARDLTQQLLTFSRGGAPVKKAVFIGQLLVETTNFALRGSSIRPEFSLADDTRPVDIDEGQMSQVMTNLIINACEAMPQGGKLQVSARNLSAKEARSLKLAPGNHIEVTVSDQGVGILPEHIGRIFEPYFTTKQKGSGLGLATAYSIIKNHDGRITVESEVGRGTTFHIYFPAAKGPSVTTAETNTYVPITGRGRLLVMDDEDIIREFLYHELTDLGYDVTVTSDGAEAVEQYEKAKKKGEPYDAVILDLTIKGGIGGRETIKRLRAIDPKVKAIASSGYATDPIMAQHRKYGFRAVVAKPYRVGELERTLRDVLKPKQ